ncbi:uncharacterized protein LOC116250673 [Nymphaea colorata]|nr:uncharacterized protein LOC116250673 [Nymphaea colorata]
MEGAAVHLKDLPSRGLFSSPTVCSSMGGLRSYVCDKDTTPPVDQVIRTDQTNILIRALTLKKHETKAKNVAEGTKGKRSAERGLDRSSAKRANKANDSSSRCRGNDLEDLQNMTVERLRALLKAKGLSTKGKKDELVERLREHSERRKSAASKNKSGEEASRSKVSE